MKRFIFIWYNNGQICSIEQTSDRYSRCTSIDVNRKLRIIGEMDYDADIKLVLCEDSGDLNILMHNLSLIKICSSYVTIIQQFQLLQNVNQPCGYPESGYPHPDIDWSYRTNAPGYFNVNNLIGECQRLGIEIDNCRSLASPGLWQFGLKLTNIKSLITLYCDWLVIRWMSEHLTANNISWGGIRGIDTKLTLEIALHRELDLNAKFSNRELKSSVRYITDPKIYIHRLEFKGDIDPYFIMDGIVKSQL